VQAHVTDEPTKLGNARAPRCDGRAGIGVLNRQTRDLFDEEGNSHFQRMYTPNERKTVRAIFDVLSEAPQPVAEPGVVMAALKAGATDPRAVRDVLSRLIDDFYLCERPDNTLAYALPLFGRWWSRWGTL